MEDVRAYTGSMLLFQYDAASALLMSGTTHPDRAAEYVRWRELHAELLRRLELAEKLK